MPDTLTMDQYQALKSAVDDDFATVARLHDNLLSVACEKFESAAKMQKDGSTSPADRRSAEDWASHCSHVASAVKAIMYARFPAAAKVWFND